MKVGVLRVVVKRDIVKGVHMLQLLVLRQLSMRRRVNWTPEQPLPHPISPHVSGTDDICRLTLDKRFAAAQTLALLRRVKHNKDTVAIMGSRLASRAGTKGSLRSSRLQSQG
ncbi:unnamed protein product [Ceratitis capitata]|uniref:(Mediterranean fruit fly) hypothetical protein n=1 Tax=Ceratitis capitata TaxID=7213 RepID=A0A811U811_CERCA|nr:unnamed protein product [Ceratitis capitata]